MRGSRYSSGWRELGSSPPFFIMVRQPLLVLGFLIFVTSRSHSDTPHSAGLPWTSGHPCAETSPSLIKPNTHNRQTSMPPPRFEPAIPASERPQTYALDRAATEIGDPCFVPNRNVTKPAVDECARNTTRSYVSSALFTLPQTLDSNEDLLPVLCCSLLYNS